MKHGTTTGYQYHGCRCDECRAAETAYVRRYRQNPENRRRNMNMQTERFQALFALRDRHRLEYEELLAAIRSGEVIDA